jgi:hypothetical protein
MTCGIAPLTGGLSILLLYWLSGWDGFVGFGVMMLLLGGVMTLIGLVSAITYLASAFRATVDRRRAIRNGAIAVTIVLANVPAAVFCTFLGGGLFGSRVATFVIKNASTMQIDRGILFQARHKTDFGAIRPGESATVHLRIESSGPVVAEVLRNGTTIKSDITGSVDEDDYRWSSQTTVTVTNAGITNSSQ